MGEGGIILSVYYQYMLQKSNTILIIQLNNNSLKFVFKTTGSIQDLPSVDIKVVLIIGVTTQF